MDCRSFRTNHLAYLDDTLPGDEMAAAQRHVLACDACAAHDTRVRRSLLLARNLPTIEPTDAFRERLQARLAACREEAIPPVPVGGWASWRTTRVAAVVAIGAVVGTVAWQRFATDQLPVIPMAPVIASQPAPPRPYLDPALVQAMATGNPMWPAALAIEDVPVQFVATDYSFADDLR